MEATHASFFSGVGGLDLGLERAGWRTVSFSEIDPYACAVLTERWSGVPNVGDILRLRLDSERSGTDSQPESNAADREWHRAQLWTGGFPCQDLSVAGKRRGMVDGTRSNLAHAFLDLVERHRPPAILLENVPGLLSSHRGRDMAVLLGRMVELGYGVAYRVLDAQHFGVPQRRRRVFIVGLRSDPDDVGGRVAAERAAAVLSVGARCGRHPATGHETGPGAADSPTPGVDIARVTGTTWKRHDEDTDTLIANGLRASDGHHGYSSPRGDGADNLVSTPPDADRVRAADGLAGRPHDRAVAFNPYRTLEKDGSVTSGWAERPVVDALHGPTGNKEPLVAQTLNSGGNNGGFRTEPGAHLTEGSAQADDPLLPLGLDSHRYRCCGNGVVAPVAEWLGHHLLAAISPPPKGDAGHRVVLARSAFVGTPAAPLVGALLDNSGEQPG